MKKKKREKGQKLTYNSARLSGLQTLLTQLDVLGYFFCIYEIRHCEQCSHKKTALIVEFKIPWSSELLESFLVSFFKKFIFHKPAGQMTLALKSFLIEKSSFSETGTPF